MTLKRYYLLLMAALAVFACTPGATLEDGSEPEEEQVPGDDDGKDDDPSHPDDPQNDDDRTRVSYGTVDGISATEGTLYGSFDDALAAPAQAGFEWGLSASALTENIASQSSVSGQRGEFSAKLTGLAPDTEYFFRAYIQVPVNGENRTYRSAVSSFRTEAAESPQQASQPGWFELPVMDIAMDGKYMVSASDNSLYYAMHICPDVYGPVSGRLARNYTVCYSSEHHCPLWVSAPRHDMYSVKNVQRTDAYAQDPDIPAEVQYSSKSTGGSCNKGHMLGSAERLVSAATNRQVFYYTNIAPQLSANFNTGGGRWNVLEDYVDTQVCTDTLYETLGCYFEPYTDAYGQSATPVTISFGSRDDVVRPTMFYYVLLRTKSGNSGKALSQCSASELKCVAFVRSHVNVRQAVTAKDLMSVSDLEKITGVTYFANVPQAPKDTFTASDWGL